MNAEMLEFRMLHERLTRAAGAFSGMVRRLSSETLQEVLEDDLSAEKIAAVEEQAHEVLCPSSAKHFATGQWHARINVQDVLYEREDKKGGEG